MHTTFDTPAPLHVTAELGAGQLVITAADVTESVVDIHGPRAEEFTVTQDGDKLAVLAPRGRFFGVGDSHQVLVTVPTGSDVVTKTGSAGVETAGQLAHIKLKSGSGDISVERATGHALIEAGSGDIRGGEFGGDVKVKSGSGDVALGDVHGAAAISTGSGDVVIGLARSTTVMKTGSGDLEVKRSESDVNLFTASGDVSVGFVPQGKVTAKNMSGDVRVGVPAGTPVWTDVSSVTGHITSNLTSAGKPEPGQPYVEIRATTVSGDVILQQA